MDALHLVLLIGHLIALAVLLIYSVVLLVSRRGGSALAAAAAVMVVTGLRQHIVADHWTRDH